jgi:ADP-ribosylglycohydrolase
MGMPALYSIERTKEIFGGEITTFIDASKDPNIDPVHHLLPAGMVTDDTYAALAIVKAIIQTGQLSVDAFARNYIEWVEETDALTAALGCQRGFAGPSTRASIEKLKVGIDPREAGKEGHTNGAAMRVAPIGFLYPGDLQATVDAAEISAIPTHNTNVAISAAAAVACAVSVCAKGENSIERIIEAAKTGAELGKRKGKAIQCPSIAKRIDLAIEIASVDKNSVEIRQDIYDLVGTSLLAYEIVPAAMAILFMGKGDPVLTIRLAINVGGDNDTLGAIVGGILGAWKGFSAFPHSYSEKIETVNHFNLRKVSEDYLSAIEEMHRKGV